MNAPFNPSQLSNPYNLPVELHKFKSELCLQIEQARELLKGNKELIQKHIMDVLNEEIDVAFGKDERYWSELIKDTWDAEWSHQNSAEAILTDKHERTNYIWTMAVLHARDLIDDTPIEELFDEELI